MGVKEECILSKFYLFLLFSFTHFIILLKYSLANRRLTHTQKDYTVSPVESHSHCKTRRGTCNIFSDCKTGNSPVTEATRLTRTCVSAVIPRESPRHAGEIPARH